MSARKAWLEGTTEEGVHVVVYGDPYIDPTAEIYIDGVEQGPPHVQRARDGGTTRISTDSGMIVKPGPLSSPAWVATFEGAPLT